MHMVSTIVLINYTLSYATTSPKSTKNKSNTVLVLFCFKHEVHSIYYIINALKRFTGFYKKKTNYMDFIYMV